MKGNCFYSTKFYSVDGTVLLKPNLKVTVVEQVKNNLMFVGDSEGMLKYELFMSLFSPFKLNQIVYHDFYGIGQIVISHKENVGACISFFSNPDRIYDVGENGIRFEDLTT